MLAMLVFLLFFRGVLSTPLLAGNPELAKKDLFTARQAALAAEEEMFLGADLALNEQEMLVNEMLMQMKHEELETAFQASHYAPSQSFFNTKKAMEASPIFSFLRSLPKGIALHLHDISISTIDWVIAELMQDDGLFVCDDGVNWIQFTHSLSTPVEGCSVEWKSVTQVREEMGVQKADAYFKSYLVINVDNPAEVYGDINAVWSAFHNCFICLNGILSYEPNFRAYLQRGFGEFLEDNVQHLQIRAAMPPSLCTNKPDPAFGVTCDPLTELQLAQLYKEEAELFTEAHSDEFCGISMVFAPMRKVELEAVEDYLVLAQQLMKEYPGFFLGFDLVGQEDLGRPLIDFVDPILQAIESDPDMRFFFHAAETNWQGQSTDINVIDALLLNTTRIGHGYGIIKHPEAMRLARERDIPIEVNPISNQVLGLVADIRNHPAAVLIQEGFPMVISSDDPGTWEAVGLSHDYYETFMALAGRDMDLRLLKKLVFNSVEYSQLPEERRDKCRTMVQNKWDKYMSSFAKSP